MRTTSVGSTMHTAFSSVGSAPPEPLANFIEDRWTEATREWPHRRHRMYYITIVGNVNSWLAILRRVAEDHLLAPDIRRRRIVHIARIVRAWRYVGALRYISDTPDTPGQTEPCPAEFFTYTEAVDDATFEKHTGMEATPRPSDVQTETSPDAPDARSTEGTGPRLSAR